ncbi:hypothetical protein HD806DRAFT_509850 [Xylariaceae sp. AK1471]|nr:hypothetical protein HD806DRAFT_509850 [Xylariaceae sp. AK1471]
MNLWTVTSLGLTDWQLAGWRTSSTTSPLISDTNVTCRHHWKPMTFTSGMVSMSPEPKNPRALIKEAWTPEPLQKVMIKSGGKWLCNGEKTGLVITAQRAQRI